MSTSPDVIVALINSSRLLSGQQKLFLISRLGSLSQIEMLKLTKALQFNSTVGLSTFFNQPIAKSLAPVQPSTTIQAPLAQIVASNSKETSNDQPTQIIPSMIVSNEVVGSLSAFGRIEVLGQPVVSFTGDAVPLPIRLEEIEDPRQLFDLDIQHIDFDLDTDADRVVQLFTNKLARAFGKVKSINERRGYFVRFMNSPLFYKYINTGITGLQRQSPTGKIVLNILHKESDQYLNSQQFKIAAKLTAQVRNLCAL